MALLQKNGDLRFLWWFCCEEGDDNNVITFFYGSDIVKKSMVTCGFLFFFVFLGPFDFVH